MDVAEGRGERGERGDGGARGEMEGKSEEESLKKGGKLEKK